MRGDNLLGHDRPGLHAGVAHQVVQRLDDAVASARLGDAHAAALDGDGGHAQAVEDGARGGAVEGSADVLLRRLLRQQAQAERLAHAAQPHPEPLGLLLRPSPLAVEHAVDEDERVLSGRLR